jgi:integrase
LTDEERVALLDACAKSEWRPLHTLILLAITTGGRKGELIRLEWSDVDLKKGRALVRETLKLQNSTFLPHGLVARPNRPRQAARRAQGGAWAARPEGHRVQSCWALLKEQGSLRYSACRHMQLAYDAHRHLSVFIELSVSSGAARA